MKQNIRRMKREERMSETMTERTNAENKRRIRHQMKEK